MLLDENLSLESISKALSDKTTLKDFSSDMLDEAGILIVQFAWKLIFAILILAVGFKLVNAIVKFTRRLLQNSDVDITLEDFIASLLQILLKVVVVLAAVAELGIATSSIITILGSAGLAVGLSLQGSLSNVAGGVVILFIKPFVGGDYIVDELSGQEGTVQTVGILYTKILTLNNRTVMIPNGTLANSTIINWTYEKKRMEEIQVGIEYAEDIDNVRRVLTKVAGDNPYCLKEEPIMVLVKSFEASSINMELRFWVSSEDYLPAKWQAQEDVKKAFDANGITIPFNQLDVNISRHGF